MMEPEFLLLKWRLCVIMCLLQPSAVGFPFFPFPFPFFVFVCFFVGPIFLLIHVLTSHDLQRHPEAWDEKPLLLFERICWKAQFWDILTECSNKSHVLFANHWSPIAHLLIPLFLSSSSILDHSLSTAGRLSFWKHSSLNTYFLNVTTVTVTS